MPTLLRSEQTNPSGWSPAGETWTYASADDPTFTFTISGDKTSKYSAGMRIKLTQTTVKYFIITKVEYSAPNTTVTVYGGTDYDLADAAISLNYFSCHKAPHGFPLDPSKWTVETTDTDYTSQASPVQNTWYNIDSINIVIPIGCWDVSYQVTARGDRNTAGAIVVQTTLSTANNSASDADFTVVYDGYMATLAFQWVDGCFMRKNKILNLAAKTTYYLNERTTVTDVDAIDIRGDSGKTIIRAICAYL